MISWKNHFLYLADYQHWANDQLFAALDKLSDEARKRDEGMFYKSIHGTLNHLLAANLIWLGRFKQEPADYRFDQILFEDWRELKLATKQTVRQSQHFIEAQPAEFFDGELRFKNASGKEQTHWVHDILTHLALRLAHHRGQVAGVAARLGAPVVEMDYLEYRRDMQETLSNARQASGR
ncbi:DinB family protein [Chitinimonas sp.]|uniref:DinB family protein n=1 Tax=Chitinimonas sp. TaxID=1934313 RepID=UPI0035B37F3F